MSSSLSGLRRATTRTVAVALALAVTLLALACSGDSTSTPADTATQVATGTAAATPTATASVEATEVPTTRIVEDTVGSVEVPIQPQRIVTFGPFAPALLALEAPVVGIARLNPNTLIPEIRARYEAIEIVGQQVEIDLEAVTRLEPDLIVSTIPARGNFDYTLLEEIAPVLVFAPDAPAEWADMAGRIADAIGRSETYEAQQAAYEARAAEIAAEYADVLEAVTFGAAEAGVGNSDWRRNYALGYTTNALLSTGIQVPGEPASGERLGFEALSFEHLGDLDAVDVILIDGGSDGQPTETAQILLDQPVWATLTPVQAGMVYPLAWATPRDYPTASYTLDAFEDILAQIRDVLGE